MQIITGEATEALRLLPSGCCSTCVTSPPYYGLRNYGEAGQIGLEETPEEYTRRLVEVFREVRRVLKDDGTLWLNIGDSYAASGKGRNRDGRFNEKAENIQSSGQRKSRIRRTCEGNGLKRKDLIGIPWLLAFALRADGWYLRSDIIWQKPNAMPESVKDRPTRAHTSPHFQRNWCGRVSWLAAGTATPFWIRSAGAELPERWQFRRAGTLSG